MRYDIPKTDDLTPRNIRMILAQLTWETSTCLANRHEFMEYGTAYDAGASELVEVNISDKRINTVRSFDDIA